jgi:hypothetical protein
LRGDTLLQVLFFDDLLYHGFILPHIAVAETVLQPNVTLQAREIAGARDERALLPVALQALVRCFSRAEEEIRWDAQVYAKSLNLWE